LGEGDAGFARGGEDEVDDELDHEDEQAVAEGEGDAAEQA
jgi:hypothetical protein